ncbi:hypothetical protein EMA8858_03778 [Emticicia aquatica]|uniref:Uncharacterized protein n=1 Tax=Emticicia aquatica TaxID=1681835 RepID=A0ABM9AV17_9BACT|nr:hypothetical protein [Emticicia aquatica]CAH0997644.1 hypothetical protein EMA8858_03778 [Emticicia aquatica]
MENSDKITQEINQTLASIESIERASPRAFFYTRLEAKMQEKYNPLPKIMLRPAFIWSFLALIVVLNISVIVRYSQKTKISNEQNARSFAKEYGLDGFEINL